MKELIISSLIAIAFFIIGKMLNLEDVALQNCIDAIPVIIPTFIMWKNSPKNYLKFIMLFRKNITYTYTAKVSSCDISPDEFRDINEYLKKFNDKYGGNSKKVLSCDIDDCVYTSILEVDSTFIKLHYNIESGVLLIESTAKLLYRVFIDRIQLINDALNKATTKYCFSELLISLKLDFISDNESESRNPFIEKVFTGFSKKIISICYRAANNSEVRISNHTIEFLSNSISNLNKDIRSELTLFGLIRQ